MSLSDFIPKRKPQSPRELWLAQQDSSMNNPPDDRPNFPPITPGRDPRLVQRSERAAEAAQHVVDLENSLASAQHEIEGLRARNSVIEEANKLLHEELDSLKRDNNRLLRENVEVHTRVTAAAEALMRIIKTSPHEPQLVETPEHAIQQALQEPLNERTNDL